MTVPLLRLDEVSVTLGRTLALERVTFAPPPGWTAIVGPNGAGKSTLLRVLAGLQAADAGEVTLNARRLAAWPAQARGASIAWLSQQSEASGELTVREVVHLGRLPHLGLFAAPRAADEAAVDRAMAASECSAWQSRRLHELSGGERQRVLLARALAVEAPILLLDEPSVHLDPPHQVALVHQLQRQVRAGRTVVSVLHDLSLALAADRLVVMDHGRIRAEGLPADPAVQAALVDVFGGAIRIQRIRTRWISVAELDPLSQDV